MASTYGMLFTTDLPVISSNHQTLALICSSIITPAASLARWAWSAEHLAGALATTAIRPVILIESAPVNAFASLSTRLFAALVVYLSGVISEITALSADSDGREFSQICLLLSTMLETEMGSSARDD